MKGSLPCVKGSTPGWHLLLSCWTAFLSYWKNYPCDLQIECPAYVFTSDFIFPFIKSVETFPGPLNVWTSAVLCGTMAVTILFAGLSLSAYYGLVSMIMLGLFNRVQFFVTPWTVACQAPLSMGFSRQEYWRSCHAFLQGIFPTQESNLSLLHLLHCRWILYHWATRRARISLHIEFSSVQSLSRVWLFATPWIAAHQASLSITNSGSSLNPMSIESVMPSSHLILCYPLLLPPPIPPSIRVFSNESTLLMRWPTYWSFSFSISPSNEHPGPISFRMDWLDRLAIQGTLKSLHIRDLYKIFSIHINSARWPLQFSLCKWGHCVFERLVHCFLFQLVCGTVGFRASRAHALPVGPCHSSVSLPYAILVFFLHNLSLDLGSSSFLSQPLRESDELISSFFICWGNCKFPEPPPQIPFILNSCLLSKWPPQWLTSWVVASGWVCIWFSSWLCL